MPDFSIILQSPEVRQLVQDGILERAFHDALFPRLLFRGEASPVLFPGNIGDTMIFTGVGLIKPNMKPVIPGVDPTPKTYSKEQWAATVQQYADSIDTHMPTSALAIANLFLRNAQQIGMQSAMTLNRIVRNRMYNAALSGWTTLAAGAAAVSTISVTRLNGFTKARRPDLAAGSPAKYDTVSSTNPLQATYNNAGVPTAVNVIGFTAATPGDENGPGTLLLDAAITAANRSYFFAADATSIVRPGGVLRTDDIPAGQTLTLALIRSAVARFRTQNVPEYPDRRFHAHLDPTHEAQVFSDAEFQRLLQSLPDYYMYKDFALGELLGVIFLRDSECPLPETVSWGLTTGLQVWDSADNFAGELYNTGSTTGTKLHQAIFSAQGGIMEYYVELSQLLTEAGVTGKVGEPSITNNGIDVFSDRIQLIIRSPLNRLQDMVSTSWKFIGDWPVRTDGAVGDAARYKRFLSIQTTE